MPGMKVTRGHEHGAPSEQRGPTFTGPVWADPAIAIPGGPTVNTVFFPPGARTHWHDHEAGQLLLVSHGRGWAQVRDGDGAVLDPGAVVWFPPGEVHWHGALPGAYLVHTAISLGTTNWLDAVADAHYGTVVALAG